MIFICNKENELSRILWKWLSNIVVSLLAGRELPVYTATDDARLPSMSLFAPPHDCEHNLKLYEVVQKNITKPFS